MMLRAARILVIAGIGFFCLRGVVGVMAASGMAITILLLLGGAVAFDRLCLARGRCLIGELAQRQGLLSADRVARVLSLQRAAGGRFGEIAVRESYLTSSQLGQLLELQLR